MRSIILYKGSVAVYRQMRSDRRAFKRRARIRRRICFPVQIVRKIRFQQHSCRFELSSVCCCSIALFETRKSFNSSRLQWAMVLANTQVVQYNLFFFLVEEFLHAENLCAFKRMMHRNASARYKPWSAFWCPFAICIENSFTFMLFLLSSISFLAALHWIVLLKRTVNSNRSILKIPGENFKLLSNTQ